MCSVCFPQLWDHGHRQAGCLRWRSLLWVSGRGVHQPHHISGRMGSGGRCWILDCTQLLGRAMGKSLWNGEVGTVVRSTVENEDPALWQTTYSRFVSLWVVIWDIYVFIVSKTSRKNILAIIQWVRKKLLWLWFNQIGLTEARFKAYHSIKIFL